MQSRLLSLTSRRAAAYKGIYSLVLAKGARDWMYDQALDKVQYSALLVDIHRIFPFKWCVDNKIDYAKRESIVNKTPLAALTNRTIGGVAPSRYIAVIEKKAQLDPRALDKLLETHAVNPHALRSDDFDAHFEHRIAEIISLIESATGKTVQLDLAQKAPLEDLAHFDPVDVEDGAASEGDDAELELDE